MGIEGVGEREDRVAVRRLEPEDIDAVIAIDARNVGRRRDEYFKVKLQHSLEGFHPAPRYCLDLDLAAGGPASR